MLKNMSVSKLLYSLLGIFVVGFLFLESFTALQMRQVLVNGPIYKKIVQGNELVADILPPPEYIIESYLNVLQMTKESDPKKLELLMVAAKKLETDFIERHEYWLKELPENDLKKEFLIDSYAPAMEFYSIFKKEFLPAIQSKDVKKAVDLAFGKMKDLYEIHRGKIDIVVTKANLKIKNDVNESQEIISATVRNLIVMAIIFMLLFTFIFIVILKNVLKFQEEMAKAQDEAVRSMLEKSPVSTAIASPSGEFIYLNDMSKTTLRKLEQYLPAKVENLVGKNMDFLYKNPSEKSLPIKTVVMIGPDKLDLVISALYDKDGKFSGPILTWDIITDKIALIDNLTKDSEDLVRAATNVLSIASNLSSAVEETSAQANTASVASEEVNSGVQTVASNMEEMVTAIKEITKTTNEASFMTNEAMRITQETNVIINKLGDSSTDIGNVIKVISSIAQQTNLLALNATIEAARAGEAGKGFAVVANEVKELANQTAKATSDITKKIETIQKDSKNAVEAITKISSAIEKVNGFTGTIAASIEQQAATTNEVTRIVNESAYGVKQISENILQVSQAAASTGKDASNAQVAAKGVGEIATSLQQYVDQLKA